MAQRGDVARAFQMLEQGIAAGDSVAAATLAEWRMAGDLIRRDLGLARDLFGTAAKLGLAAAEPVHIALLASGAGAAERHWGEAVKRLGKLARHDAIARKQSDLLAAMHISGQGDPLTVPPAEPVCQSPMIQRFTGFLSSTERRYLIDRATPLLQPAVVVHPQTGQLVNDPVRTARSAAFPFVLEDPVIHAINRRIAAATGTTYQQGEPLQVLCYQPGEEYKLHSDALPHGPNQRVLTFLCWLNEDYQGGETAFPEPGLKLRGSAGDAIQFRNVTDLGTLDERARHCGKAVASGRKWLLSKWIRQRPLDLAGPPGRPF